MCVPPTLRFYGVGGVALFAEITAAAIPVWGCCSFFLFLFSGQLSPWLLRIGNVRLPTGRFQTFSGSPCLKAHWLPEANLILLP